MENGNKSGGGFFNGFILGLLVGAGLVFLFGTQKGKRVLQLLLEQVEENTELSDLLEIPEDEDEEYFDAIEEEPEEELEPHHEEEPEEVDMPVRNGHHSPVAKTTAKVKRFFKGSPKKLIS